MDYEITFTQEQKIKRFVKRFKFDTNSSAFELALDDITVDADGTMNSHGNEDVEGFSILVGDSISRFVEKLLGRKCRCYRCDRESDDEDEEFNAFYKRVRDGFYSDGHWSYDGLWNKFSELLYDAAIEKRDAIKAVPQTQPL